MSISTLALKFISKGIIPSGDNIYFCQTRDQVSARLPNWMKMFIELGMSEMNAAILTAILGELTNNSFDHNLGRWNEPSGCVVAFERKEGFLNISVADRGQGIITSLEHLFKEKYAPDEILRKAFEERISGRAPEKRGNGLKFVTKHIQTLKNSIVCYSQGAIYKAGGDIQFNTNDLPKSFGTLIHIKWRI